MVKGKQKPAFSYTIQGDGFVVLSSAVFSRYRKWLIRMKKKESLTSRLDYLGRVAGLKEKEYNKIRKRLGKHNPSEKGFSRTYRVPRTST